MSNTDTSGPAFPCDRIGSDRVTSSPGMTLRDYFAAKAMQGIMAGSHPMVRFDNPLPEIARVAYLQADAMLEARNT